MCVSSLDSRSLASEASSKALTMRKIFAVLMSRLFKQIHVFVVCFLVIFCIFSIFLKIFTFFHIDGSLTNCFINTIWKHKSVLIFTLKFRQFLPDERLNLLEYLNIILSHQRNSHSCSTSAGCSTHSMHIVFAIRRDIVVHNDVNRRDVQTTWGNISSNKNVFLIRLKLI